MLNILMPSSHAVSFLGHCIRMYFLAVKVRMQYSFFLIVVRILSGSPKSRDIGPFCTHVPKIFCISQTVRPKHFQPQTRSKPVHQSPNFCFTLKTYEQERDQNLRFGQISIPQRIFCKILLKEVCIRLT